MNCRLIVKICRDLSLSPQLFLARTEMQGEEIDPRPPGLHPGQWLFFAGVHNEAGVLKALSLCDPV